jgi:predicted permease
MLNLSERLRILLARILGAFTKKGAETDLNAELAAHLEALTEANMRRGLSADEARYAARREFGGLEQAKENYRERRGLPLIEDLLRDVQFGVRLLRKSPGFTSVAILTLALGIGANTAVFSVVDTVLLRPLPYAHPEELVVVSETLPQLGQSQELGVAPAEYLDYKERNRCFSQVAAYESDGFNLTGQGTPLRINAAQLSASAFSLLGVPAHLGRTFTEEEERYGTGKVALLSYKLWREHFGSDPSILLKTIKLNEQPYTVIGVMPASFEFPFDGAPISERADVWVPVAFPPEDLKDRTREFGVGLIGRRKPGVSVEQVRQDVESIANAFMAEYPENYTGTVRVAPEVFPFAAHTVEKTRPLVILLMAAVACVLLIACANVANLLLARASLRSREMAIRSAIGAARVRLLRQCLVESALLAALGAASGIALAVVLVDGLRAFGPANLPRLQDITLSPIVLGFTLFISIATSLIFGFVPAWRLSQTAPQGCLKQSAQVGPGMSSLRLQNAVAVGEIALALVLLIGGSLLVQSFVRLLNVPLGFDPKATVVVRTLFDTARYPDPAKRGAVQQELLRRLASLPGVTAAATASHLPLSDDRLIGFRLEHAGAADFHWAQNSFVSPGYFHATGITLIRGRDFSMQDNQRNAPPVAIINEGLAKEFFPRQDAIGQRLDWGDRDPFTIIGVTADVHISALDADPPATIYMPMFQNEGSASTRTAFILRVNHSDGQTQQGIFRAVQQQVWSLDKDLPLYGAATMETLVSESVAQRRFTTLVMGGFTVVALLLSAVGLFGVVSYLVAQRNRELALRMALGASSGEIGWMVLKRGAALGLVGCLIGLGLFVLAKPVVQANLYEIRSSDPLTLWLATALLLLLCLLAAYWPARRAMRVDPLTTLR